MTTRSLDGMTEQNGYSILCHPTIYNPQTNCAQYNSRSSWFSFINWFYSILIIFQLRKRSSYISLCFTFKSAENASPSMFNFIKNCKQKKDDWHRTVLKINLRNVNWIFHFTGCHRDWVATANWCFFMRAHSNHSPSFLTAIKNSFLFTRKSPTIPLKRKVMRYVNCY